MMTFQINALRRPAPRPSGFTLIEILTVVVILGIASAIVVPQIGSRTDLTVRTGARLLMSELIYAQNMAISSQKWHYVKFDVDAENYRVLDAAGPGGADQVIKHPITKNDFVTRFGAAGDSRVRDIKIQSAVFNGVNTLYRPEFTIAFDELGTPFVFDYAQNGSDEMLDGAIVLECGLNTITVTIERYTGEIKVQ